MNEVILDKLRAMLFMADPDWPALLEEVVTDLGGDLRARRALHDFLDDRAASADEMYVGRLMAMRDRLAMGLHVHHQTDPVQDALSNLLQMEKLVDATRAQLAEQLKQLQAYRDKAVEVMPPASSQQMGRFVVQRLAPAPVLRVTDPKEVPLSLCKPVPDPEAIRMYWESTGEVPPGVELWQSAGDLEVIEDPTGEDAVLKGGSENHW